MSPREEKLQFLEQEVICLPEQNTKSRTHLATTPDKLPPRRKENMLKRQSKFSAKPKLQLPTSQSVKKTQVKKIPTTQTATPPTVAKNLASLTSTQNLASKNIKI